MVSIHPGDSVQLSREKIFNLPAVVIALVALLIGIHGVRQLLSPEIDLELLALFGFVPGRFTFSFDPDRVSAAFNVLAQTNELRAQAARFFLGDGEPLWWTPVSYAFLHGNWMHVGLNCLWLAAFGAAVARRFRALRFLTFCFVTALAGAVAHFITHLSDLQPVIGASAVVSGTMAAAVRFVFQPGAPLDGRLGLDHADRDRAFWVPALPLRDVFSDRRAMSFLTVWFLVNFIFGAASQPLGITEAAVAWEAHIGGFLVGLLGFRWFDPQASKLQ
jgi:membrane associated rhomboid family serine protease